MHGVTACQVKLHQVPWPLLLIKVNIAVKLMHLRLSKLIKIWNRCETLDIWILGADCKTILVAWDIMTFPGHLATFASCWFLYLMLEVDLPWLVRYGRVLPGIASQEVLVCVLGFDNFWRSKNWLRSRWLLHRVCGWLNIYLFELKDILLARLRSPHIGIITLSERRSLNVNIKLKATLVRTDAAFTTLDIACSLDWLPEHRRGIWAFRDGAFDGALDWALYRFLAVLVLCKPCNSFHLLQIACFLRERSINLLQL